MAARDRRLTQMHVCTYTKFAYLRASGGEYRLSCRVVSVAIAVRAFSIRCRAGGRSHSGGVRGIKKMGRCSRKDSSDV
jgi:hypothetical protein